MEKVSDARRALFEKWFMANRPLNSSPDLWLKTDIRGEYFVRETYTAWQAFNAALDAVEIELPGLTGMDKQFTGTPISEIRAHNHYNQAVGQCRAAIESTNLGLRIK
jgi:hypothetical protein